MEKDKETQKDTKNETKEQSEQAKVQEEVNKATLEALTKLTDEIKSLKLSDSPRNEKGAQNADSENADDKFIERVLKNVNSGGSNKDSDWFDFMKSHMK